MSRKKQLKRRFQDAIPVLMILAMLVICAFALGR